MNLKNTTLRCMEPALRFTNRVSCLMGICRPRLRVLMYHNVLSSEKNQFESTLRYLSRQWNFITPLQFEEVMQGRRKIDKNSLLLTFDDGFRSNLLIAADILSSLKIKALFFVIPDFVEKIGQDQVREFIVNRLKLKLYPRDPVDQFSNMDWSDLGRLLENGHAIGAHSMSHEPLGDGASDDILDREIIKAADRLESKLGTQIRHFAFPFGNFDSFDTRALEIAMSRYSFIHSGIRGNNIPGSFPRTIRRDALKPADKESLVGALLLGGADLRYRHFNRLLDDWMLERTC